MKNEFISSKLKHLCDRILEGNFPTFAFYFVIGLIVFCLLFATVHKRSDLEISKKVPQRYSKLIQFWFEKGYVKHGGLWIFRDKDNKKYGKKYWWPPENDPVKWVYRSSPMGHIFIPYLAEKLYYSITGRYSFILMRLYNQFLVLTSSALLALLAMRVCLRMGVKSYHCLLFGLYAQIIYQTFPVNLNSYWEVYYTTVMPIFFLIFLLSSELLLFNERISRKILIIRGISVFGMCYIDFPTAVFFLSFYLMACSLLWREKELNHHHIIKTIVIPTACAIILYSVQLSLVMFNNPDVQFVGSDIMFRTGFDGSTLYYTNHFDLFSGRRDRWSFLYWPYLFWAGVASLGIIVALKHRFEWMKYPVLILATTTGLYAPFAFVFSQVTIIHPYAYDAYLVMTIILSFFSFFPAVLENLTNNHGTYVFLFGTIAFCYTMVSIREYVICYPLAG